MPTASSSTTDSLVDFTGELVRVPSRGGIDPYGPVLEMIVNWLQSHGIAGEVIRVENGDPIAAIATIGDPNQGPTYLLNATADTADFGDESTWTCAPLSGMIRDGWLYGRGSADSKAGISIFCHVAVALNEFAHRLSGATTLLFDVEEHSGAFLGIRRFVESLTKNVEIKAAMIGYPGQDRIIIGSRGFHRAKIRIHGQATHSGSSKSRGVNAIVRALHLVEALQQADLPTEVSLSFPLPPQLTVTQIQGGQGFSVVPDLCALNVDIRLTPVFKASHARELLAETVRRLDFEDTGVRATEIETIEGWPAYVIETSNPIVETLQASARRVLGCTPEIGVAGPSGIGNYLASLGIPATSGFGVVYRNVHAADERIALDSLLPAYQVYLGAIAELLGVFDVAAP